MTMLFRRRPWCLPPGTLRSSTWTRTRFFFHHLQRVVGRKSLTKNLRHWPGQGSSSSTIHNDYYYIPDQGFVSSFISCKDFFAVKSNPILHTLMQLMKLILRCELRCLRWSAWHRSSTSLGIRWWSPRLRRSCLIQGILIHFNILFHYIISLGKGSIEKKRFLSGIARIRVGSTHAQIFWPSF